MEAQDGTLVFASPAPPFPFTPAMQGHKLFLPYTPLNTFFREQGRAHILQKSPQLRQGSVFTKVRYQSMLSYCFTFIM